MSRSPAEIAYLTLTSEDDGRVCRDIPDDACHEQPRNFLLHVASLGATKTGDGLADPKLTLAWLLTALNAPTAWVGLLVPVREAGALLPQLVTAGCIRSLPLRKYAWAFGAAVQGAAVAGIALVALSLRGVPAGAAIVGLLAVFALARSICSVSYKDVLGKTVSKATRGTATGAAATIAAVLVFAFGLALSTRIIPLTITTITIALFVAAALWLLAATLFISLREVPGATEGGGNPLRVALDQVKLLRTDTQLRRFILSRALLTVTALAPPYIVSLSGPSSGGQLGSLGPFVLASSLAAMLSTYLWGRLADRSSRRALIYAALGAAVVLAATTLAAWLPPNPPLATWLYPALLFLLMVAYQGVRLGRSTHIVDMADEDRRAAYTALSNTIIGLTLLFVGGAFAAVAAWLDTAAVLLLFAFLAAAAALTAGKLEEVQRKQS